MWLFKVKRLNSIFQWFRVLGLIFWERPFWRVSPIGGWDLHIWVEPVFKFNNLLINGPWGARRGWLELVTLKSIFEKVKRYFLKKSQNFYWAWTIKLVPFLKAEYQLNSRKFHLKHHLRRLKRLTVFLKFFKKKFINFFFRKWPRP